MVKRSWFMSVNGAGYAEAARDAKSEGGEMLTIPHFKPTWDGDYIADDIEQLFPMVDFDELQTELEESDWTSSPCWFARMAPPEKGQPHHIKPNQRFYVDLTGMQVSLKMAANTTTMRYLYSKVIDD